MKFCARLWLLVIVLNSNLLAQPFTSRTLSLQQGLPEFYVSGLVQDKAGFIWVATRDGLARYDGRQFKVFRHRPFNNRSLADNVIRAIQSVSDSTMLIHLDNDKFQLFNPVNETFSELVTNKQNQQNQISLANARLTPDEKRLWGRYQTKLIRFDRQTGQFKTYSFPILPDRGHYPGNSILLSKHQQLYAPVPGYLLRFDPQNGTYQTWDNPRVGLPGLTETYYGTSLLERTNGEILISGVSQLDLFNPRTHRFRTLPIPGSINTQVGLLYEAPDGQVYLTHAMTVYRLSLNDQLTPIWTAPRIDYQNYFHALLLDRSGVLWIGTNGDGIQQIDLRALPIKTYPYRTNFFQDVLSIEQRMSLPAWAKTDKQIYQLRLAGPAPYLSVGLDDRYELLRGEPGQGGFRSILEIKQTKPKNGAEGGNALRRLADGTLWMYTPYHGLLKADSTGRLLETFAFPSPINWVSSIQPMGQLVWVGSQESGLYGYDIKTHRIVRQLHDAPAGPQSIPSDHVLCLVADPVNPHVLWVGTQAGLSRLNTHTMRCQHWTDEQGLPSSTINSLLADRGGQVWFSTGKGITRLDPRTLQMRHFTTADGLLDIEYRQNHALQLPDGRLAFGGATGVTVFDPLALTEAFQPIPTVLTALSVVNELVEPGQANSPLSRPLNATETLRLKPTQNFFSLEYAGLHYNKPTSLSYRYQLTGVDAGWVQAGSHTVATYTQVGAGDYEFRVNTADAGGRWSPLIKTIRIIVDPPWWKTGWAYGLYVFLLAALIRAYIQYRLKEQEAQLAKNNADWQTRFFTNITHEFRTPLTLIINPLEKLLDTSVASPLQQQYGVMHRNAQRLLRLINQLLDIARLEAGQMGLVYVRGNLTSFVADLVDSFRLRAERKGITMRLEATHLPADSLFDAAKLETIGYNLLANALKFTPEGGQIRVVLRPEVAAVEPMICFQVIDTGIGIPAEQLPFLFDRFFQGRQTEASMGVGTGIGLFLVAEFTRLLGGTVAVESQPGQGTSFTVRLPLKDPSTERAPLAPLPSLQHPFLANPVVEVTPAPTLVSADTPLVLVVEDNDELREFIAGELTRQYRVLTAPDGQQGWQTCLAELPDLVISDVMMPLMDGFALVERIKTTPLTAHIAVMLLTAKTMADARLQGLSAGANDYLAKPFNGQELHLRIGNQLRHQQQLRQHWQQQISRFGGIPLTVPATGLLTDDPFLVKLYAVLDRKLANPSFGVDQLADELAVSSRTLLRKLDALTGTNANELIRSYRLRKAAGLLDQGCSVSEAAEKAGFEGLSYFAKMFKAQFGVSPSAYRLAQNRP